MRAFRAALASNPPDRAQAHVDLAEAYASAGQVPEAKKEILAALEIAPSFERAQDLLLKIVEALPGRRSSCQIVPPLDALTLRTSEGEHADDAGREARDMGPERHAARGSPAVAAAIEPTPLSNCITNQIPRKKIAGTSMIWNEDEQRQQRDDARVGIEDEVGTHDARDSAAGADHRHDGSGTVSVCPSAAAVPHSR